MSDEEPGLAPRDEDNGRSDHRDGVRVLRTRARCVRRGRPDVVPDRDVEVELVPRRDREPSGSRVVLRVVGARAFYLRDLVLRLRPERLLEVELGDADGDLRCEDMDDVVAEALDVVLRLAADGLAQVRWDRRVEWLWRQSDAAPQEDTARRAWARIFGDELPPESAAAWISVVDRGDAWASLDAAGRVYDASYPGAERIGVLPGSLAWERLRDRDRTAGGPPAGGGAP